MPNDQAGSRGHSVARGPGARGLGPRPFSLRPLPSVTLVSPSLSLSLSVSPSWSLNPRPRSGRIGVTSLICLSLTHLLKLVHSLFLPLSIFP